jgi:DHA1 family multidrug resistance protein-like MFS transporter
VSLGGTFQIAAYTLAARAIITFFINPIWGTYADTVGPKEVMIWNCFGIVVSHFLLSLTPIFELHILWRILQGAFFGFPIGAISYLLAVVPKDDQGMNIGYAGAVIGIGFNLAAISGGILANIHYRVPHVFAWILSIINCLFLMNFLDKITPTPTSTPTPTKSKSKFQAFSDILNMLRLTQLRPVLLLRTINEISLSIANTTNLEFIRSSPAIQFTLNQRSALFFILGILTLLVNANVKRISEVLGGEQYAVTSGYVACIIAIFLISFAQEVYMIISCMMVFAMSSCFQAALLNSLAAQRVSEDKRGLAISYGESMAALGGILGPLFVGFVLPLGEKFPYIFYCILVIIGIIQFWMGMSKTQ